MVQIALLVLAPLLGLLVADRRIVVGVLVAVWAVLMIPQTHTVLLDEQLATRSMANTTAYMVINDLTLVLAVVLALWLHSRRRAAKAVSATA